MQIARWGALALLIVAACAAPEDEDTASIEAELALNNGAGAGPELFGVDPCDHPAAFAKDHGYNLIVAKPNDHRIFGTNGKDLIVGTNGDDFIDARGGSDIVCAGYGEDKVHGGDGNDYLDGGGDNDKIWGEGGNDLIHGRGGSDDIWGGAGDDQIYGDILDDHLYGEGGDDLLIGGHGTDQLFGGPGNDFMRGDTGNDSFAGGDGTDVVSFSTAMPPGQGDRVGDPTAITGVKVDFTNKCEDADIGLPRRRHDGCANGDGGNEPLDGIEIVIGSPYDDVFVNDASKVRIVSSFGNDKCDGQPCGKGRPGAGKVLVAMEDTPRDVGVIIAGTDKRDVIEVVREGETYRVRTGQAAADGCSENGSQANCQRGSVGPTTQLFAGEGCKDVGAAVECTPKKKHVVKWIAGFMDDGNDVVRLAQAAGKTKAFPHELTTHFSGGNGDDLLEGGAEQDVFFSGPSGKDKLIGNDGDDALLSESRKWKPKAGCGPNDANPACVEDKPKAGQYDDGFDELYGGPGNDQLVADYPCGKHLFSGGPGKDIAGFARSGRFSIKAQLNGPAAVVTGFHGKAFNPALCGADDGTRMKDDLEILEAADGNDELWGNDEPNEIWGREGNDEIHGLGGNDIIKGLMDDDRIFGGGGNDTLLPGTGNDVVREDEN